MRRYALLLTALSLSACSGLSPYRSVGPVDQAIKACGLGYSADVTAAFKGAFQYADATQSKGIDFSASMKDSLSTQLASMLESKELGSEERAEVILKTQDCVVRLSDAYRPRARNELVNACIQDLQGRVSGAGSTQSTDTVRGWVVDSENRVGDVERLKVKAALHSYGGGSQPISFYCVIKDGSYHDVEAMKDN
ncbi:hypothetical protein [Pseudomonas tussilaginis]|uniref:hypothetical protein n=1 Tax=Pseudomonas sp. 5 TaxID=1619949 RepID=UPI0005EB5834|nr:hypothetical protein [Pseudomonas sp. 5]KJK07820.1 hypothetical protein UB47_10360 [Pseudomonas sp. 5]